MREFLNTKLHDRKGFTLAELLIVVAIISVLTAIAIPVFAGELEKSREATDLANIRAAYAEVIVDVINGNTTTTPSETVTLKQQKDDWQNTTASGNLTDIVGDGGTVTGSPKKGKTATVSWDADTEKITITFAD